MLTLRFAVGQSAITGCVTRKLRITSPLVEAKKAQRVPENEPLLEEAVSAGATL